MTKPPIDRSLSGRRLSGVANDFDGRRLSVGRRLKCMTRVELAGHLEVTPAAVTQYERGHNKPSGAVLARMSLALGLPTEFFLRGLNIPELPAGSAHFRSLRSTPAKRRDQALAFGELGLAALDIIERYVDLPNVALPKQPVGERASEREIAEAARMVRHEWDVKPGPAPNVVRLLEAHGVLVLRLPPEEVDPRVDAFSSSETASGRPLVLLSPFKEDRARSRFDASHELGHLVMHEGIEPGSRIVESQAMAFAAEFLMPEAEIRSQLPTRVDWRAFHELKEHWGVSLAALVYRGHKLGRLSDFSYRRALQDLKGWGYPEPGPLGPPEAPSVLGAAVDLLAEAGTKLTELAVAARLPTELLARVIAAGREDRPRLRLDV